MRDLISFLVVMNVAIAAAAFSEAGDFTSFAHYPIAAILSSAVTVLLLRFKVIALA